MRNSGLKYSLITFMAIEVCEILHPVLKNFNLCSTSTTNNIPTATTDSLRYGNT